MLFLTFSSPPLASRSSILRPSRKEAAVTIVPLGRAISAATGPTWRPPPIPPSKWNLRASRGVRSHTRSTLLLPLPPPLPPSQRQFTTHRLSTFSRPPLSGVSLVLYRHRHPLLRLLLPFLHLPNRAHLTPTTISSPPLSAQPRLIKHHSAHPPSLLATPQATPLSAPTYLRRQSAAPGQFPKRVHSGSL